MLPLGSTINLSIYLFGQHSKVELFLKFREVHYLDNTLTVGPEEYSTELKHFVQI